MSELKAKNRQLEQLFDLLLLPSRCRPEGTVLGLGPVKQIVEAHGGRIWVESGNPGRGACLTLAG